jgi:hypothetical protein
MVFFFFILDDREFLFFFHSICDRVNSKFLFKAFSDSFLSHFLLDSHFKLIGETDTSYVDFGNVIEVFSIGISIKNKVNSPVKKSINITKFLSEVLKRFSKEFDKFRVFLRALIGVFGTREKCGRESIFGSLRGFFVNNIDGFFSDQENSHFSLRDSFKKFHVNDQIFRNKVIFFTKFYKRSNSVFFNMVINSLSTLDSGIHR